MVVGILIVKPILRLLIGSPPDLNESIGYGTAGFSLFYGLLLGLLTVSAYQNNDAGPAGDPERGDLARRALCRHVELSRADPLGGEGDAARLYALHHPPRLAGAPAGRVPERRRQPHQRHAPAARELRAARPRGRRSSTPRPSRAFQDFAEARQQRLTGVITEIPDVLWYAVLVGRGDQPPAARDAADAAVPRSSSSARSPRSSSG